MEKFYAIRIKIDEGVYWYNPHASFKKFSSGRRANRVGSVPKILTTKQLKDALREVLYNNTWVTTSKLHDYPEYNEVHVVEYELKEVDSKKII